MIDAPLIAVTGRILHSKNINRWSNDAIASPRGYTDGIERAGGAAVVLPPVPLVQEQAAGRLERFDGLMLTGGADLNPALYGQEADPETYGIDEVVDEYELALVRAALDSGTPVLAICRGIQVLNVALGGTLDQHITGREGFIAHGVPNGGGGALHEVQVEAGTKLAKALGTDRAQCMSHHHQAIAELGRGLVATAWTSDGVVEGCELDDDRWVVAVQWHPEETAQADPIQQRLFEALVAQASS